MIDRHRLETLVLVTRLPAAGFETFEFHAAS
jgi:hypothetical protein